MTGQKRDDIYNFLEELGWLLQSYSKLNISQEISKLTRINNSSLDYEEAVPSNPNILFLAGTLPSLFMNKEIFPGNEAIAQFADKVLKVSITRWEKRSQYELIGRVVCEVTKLDDYKLVKVVKELKKYVLNQTKPTSKQITDWNEVIRRLTGEHGND